MKTQPDPVLIVGAGVGGLACALDLAARGVDVVVLERRREPGGKLRELAVGARRIDAGPTVFTMRWVFDELFAHAGARLDDHLALVPAALLARHAWNDGSRLDLHADPQRSAAAIEAFAGRREADGFRAFAARAAEVYETLESPYLRAPRPNPLSLAWRVARHGPGALASLLRISPFATLWHELGRYFHDARLRQLFGRYATYCGSSPLEAPATLMLVAHVEQAGLWTVDGGMWRLVEVLARLAVARGARLQCDADVDEILVRDGRACGVRLADGRERAASAVVFNGDTAALEQGLLGMPLQSALPSAAAAPRSLSAITWTLLAEPRGLPLLRHNVFFSDDSPAEFDALFRDGRTPPQPTVYVCAQDRGSGGGDAGPAPGPERLLCLINSPAGLGRLSETERLRCQDLMTQRLAQGGLALNPCAATPGVITTPADFARLFPGSRGALYGPASHGWQASFRRPAARCRIQGLYLAGGTTHPGPGVPMAALSGRQAAHSLMADRERRGFASTSASPRAATPGGTSTP